MGMGIDLSFLIKTSLQIAAVFLAAVMVAGLVVSIIAGVKCKSFVWIVSIVCFVAGIFALDFFIRKGNQFVNGGKLVDFIAPAFIATLTELAHVGIIVYSAVMLSRRKKA